MPTIKDASRGNYTTKDEVPTWQEVRDGALLRIADSIEKMAQRHAELIEERDRYKRWYDNERDRRQQMERSNAALRGVIARMKRVQVAPSKE